MIVPDVNVLVLAMRPDAAPSGPQVRSWLEARLAGHEQVGVAEQVLASVVRLGARHWPIFSELVTTHRLRGNDVPDAHLAAISMEAGAHLATLDPGFRRFDGLRVKDPLAP